MFLASRSNSNKAERSWLGLARPGIGFMLIFSLLLIFGGMIMCAGLMDLTVFRQPLWWAIVLLWGMFTLFTASVQIVRPGFLHASAVLPMHRQTLPLVEIEELPAPISEKENGKLPGGMHLALTLPQLASAFELPFRRVGVQTEDHHQEIEAALGALYTFDGSKEALSLCLERLLQAAWHNGAGLAAFSPREQEILDLLLQNCTYKEMSFRLHVSPSTVKTHIYHIFQKLDVSNRDEAVRLIHKRGWFSPGSPAPLLLEVSPR